jgi:hypothetical protein
MVIINQYWHSGWFFKPHFIHERLWIDGDKDNAFPQYPQPFSTGADMPVATTKNRISGKMSC